MMVTIKIENMDIGKHMAQQSDLGDLPSGFDSDSSLSSINSLARSSRSVSRHASPSNGRKTHDTAQKTHDARTHQLFVDDPPSLKRKPVRLDAINQIDRSGRTPIFKYCSSGDLDAVQQLIDAGADVNVGDYGGWTPLHEASLKGRIQVAKLLVRFGADVNAAAMNGDTPLHDAAENNFEDVCDFLLESGAQLYSKNEKEKTPLDVAADDASEVLTRWKQRFDASLAREADGTTQLHAFSAQGNVKAVVDAIQVGADVRTADFAGWTPLHEAALNGKFEVARVLLQHGASVDAKSEEGDTPLMDAAANGHVDVVKLLLEWGADANLKNQQENSALDLAHSELVGNLLKLDASHWLPHHRPSLVPRLASQATKTTSVHRNVYADPVVDLSSPRASRRANQKRDASSEPESTTESHLSGGKLREKASLSTGFGWYSNRDGPSREEKKLALYMKMIERQEGGKHRVKTERLGKTERVDRVVKVQQSPKQHKQSSGDWLDDEQIAIINREIEAFEKHRDSTSDNEDWETSRKRRPSSSRGPAREGARRKQLSGTKSAKLAQLLDGDQQTDDDDVEIVLSEGELEKRANLEKERRERHRKEIERREREKERNRKEQEKIEKQRKEKEKERKEKEREMQEKLEEDRLREKREAERREIERQRELRELQNKRKHELFGQDESAEPSDEVEVDEARPAKKQKKKKLNLMGISGYHRIDSPVDQPSQPSQSATPANDSKQQHGEAQDVKMDERDVAAVLAEMASSPPSTHTHAKEPSPLPERSRTKEEEAGRKSQEEVISAAELLANTSRPRDRPFYAANPYERKMPERKPSAHFPVPELPSSLTGSGHFPTPLPPSGHFPTTGPSSGHFPISAPAAGHFPLVVPSAGHFPTSTHFPTTSSHFPTSNSHFPAPYFPVPVLPTISATATSSVIPSTTASAIGLTSSKPQQQPSNSSQDKHAKDGLTVIIPAASAEKLATQEMTSTETPDSKKSDVDISQLPPKLRRLYGK